VSAGEWKRLLFVMLQLSSLKNNELLCNFNFIHERMKIKAISPGVISGDIWLIKHTILSQVSLSSIV
jgi:hypothetical protein